MPGKRYCKMLSLKPEESSIERYKEIHDVGAVWPEIIEGMREVGILDMELYLSKSTAFMIMDIKADNDHDQMMAELATKERQKEWEKFVSDYQKTEADASASVKWKVMTPLKINA